MDNSKENNNEDNISILSNSSDINSETPKENYDLIVNEYSCNECNSIPEIKNINFEKNTLEIKCPFHQKEIKWSDFINNALNSNLYFSVCNICNKNIQKNFNNIFQYCYNCKKIICPQCYKNHDSSHNSINNNELNIKCQKHYNKIYTSFCVNCQENICNECKKTKIHVNHIKYDFLEIEPTEEEISELLNFCLKLNSNIEEIKNNDKNEINEINKLKERKIFLIKEMYMSQEGRIKNDINQKKQELYKVYSEKIINLKKKYLEDSKKIEIEYNKALQNLENDLRMKINLFRQKNIELLNTISENYNNLVNKCIIYNQKLKTKYKQLIVLNDIITKSYYKNKTQYYYIINLSNNINFVKKYKEEMPKFFLKDINNKYNLNITEENVKIESNIITNEGIKSIISKMNKEKIKNLVINKSNINNMEFLGNFKFPYLNSFSMTECNIQKIDNLKSIECPNLIILDLSNNRISDINNLKNSTFNSLEILDLKHNNISNIDILKEDVFNNLKKIDLSYNQIVDIEVFNKAKFRKLNTLILSYNNIKNTSVLDINHLNNLINIFIDNQKI